MAESWLEERQWQETTALRTMVLSFLGHWPFHLLHSQLEQDSPKPGPQDVEVHRCVTSFTNHVIRIRVRQMRHLGFIVKMAPASPQTVCTEELTGHLPLSGAILSGQFSEEAARALGLTLATLHSATLLTAAGGAEFEQLSQQFPSRESMLSLIRTYHFQRPFDPMDTGRRCHHSVLRMLPEILEDPAVLAARKEAVTSFSNDLDCLIHGDLHIESVLIKEVISKLCMSKSFSHTVTMTVLTNTTIMLNAAVSTPLSWLSVQLVDTEFARLGPCAFDLGLLLATLLAVFHRYRHVQHGSGGRSCPPQNSATRSRDSGPSDDRLLDMALQEEDDKDDESGAVLAESPDGGHLQAEEQADTPDNPEQIRGETLHRFFEGRKQSSEEQEQISEERKDVSEEQKRTSERPELIPEKLSSDERRHGSTGSETSHDSTLLSGLRSSEGTSSFWTSRTNVKVVSDAQDPRYDEEWCSSVNLCKGDADLSKASRGKFTNRHAHVNPHFDEQERPSSGYSEQTGQRCSEGEGLVTPSDVNPRVSENQGGNGGVVSEPVCVEQTVEGRGSGGEVGGQKGRTSCIMDTDLGARGDSLQPPPDDILRKCGVLLQEYTDSMCGSHSSSRQETEKFQTKLLQNIATFTGCELLAWVVGPPHMDFMDSCPAAQVDCVLTARRLLADRHRIATVHDLVRLLT